jgi:hypothetical protein
MGGNVCLVPEARPLSSLRLPINGTSGAVTDGHLRHAQGVVDLADFDDPDEHVRFGAFVDFVKDGLHHDGRDWLVAKLSADPDQTMADAVRIYWMEEAGLPEVELAELDREPGFDSPIVQRRRREARIMRAVTETATESELLGVAESGLPRAHRLLVSRDVLPFAVVQYLADNGASKAVRNIARQRLNRREYRSTS